MLSIHAHKSFNEISIPLEEWNLIKSTLEKIDDIEVIEDEETKGNSKLVGLGNDVWDTIDPV